MNKTHQSKRLVVLVGSPRRDGNSAALAQAILAGAAEAGTSASLHFLDDYLSGFLSDERHTPPPADRYAELFLEHFLPADGAVFARRFTGTACRRKPKPFRSLVQLLFQRLPSGGTGAPAHER